MRLDRPAVLIAMDPARTAHVLTENLLDRLAGSAEILDRRPLRDFDDPRFQALAPRAEVLLTGWGCPAIEQGVREAMPRLRLVAHAAGTIKALAPPDLFAAGIAVTTSAEANARPVAEFTLAMVILALKRAFDFERLYGSTRSRQQTNPMLALPIGAARRTVGVVGASRIGRRVLSLLQSFEDIELLVSDPMLDEAEAERLGARLVSLDALCAASDVVSLHAPSLAATRHMIDASRLAAMRDGATLINTARGALVDEAALTRELQDGRLFAVIDVTEPEVPAPGSPLWQAPNLFLTPHIAGAIGLERTRLGELAIAEIERYAAGEPLLHAVDPAQLETMA